MESIDGKPRIASGLTGAVVPVASVIVALAIGAVLVWAVGDNPLKVYGILFTSALGSVEGIGYTLFYATPLIFTGLAVAFGFRCGLFNIGAEGQLYLGAFAAAWVGFTFTNLPGVALIPLCALAALAAGALWGAIPGILKAKLGVHEVINTIMLNFIAFGITNYLATYPYRAPGDQIPETVKIGASARIPRMSDMAGWIGLSFPEVVPLNLAFFLAVLTAGLVYIVLWRTKWGYEIRAVGLNPAAAQYAGISVTRNIILAMTVSGALAGLVGVHEVMGYRYRYYDNFSEGLGFIGIAVALLGKNHPIGIILSALLFGALARGSLFVDIFSEHTSKDLVFVIQALIILFVALEELFRGSLRVLVRKPSTAPGPRDGQAA